LEKAALLATLAALAFLGVVLAYWSWAWLAPPAVARAPAALAIGSATSSRNLFGSAKSTGAVSSGALRLLGVVAAPEGRRGHAVLRLDAKRTVAVLQGEEVEPGLRLAEVHADGIVLERNGVRQTLALPEKGK